MDTASMERTDSASSTARTAAFVYGAVCYALFLCTFLYAAGFVGGWFVPRTIDSGKSDPTQRALLINILILSVFARGAASHGPNTTVCRLATHFGMRSQPR